MPTHYCPSCAAPALRHLHDVSTDAHVDYFRCDDCARCFTTPKALASAALTEITSIPAVLATTARA